MRVFRLTLPVLVALVLVPFVQPGGTLWPWAPSTVDLDVYRHIGRIVLEGGDILDFRAPGTGLAFIYPPFAALVCVPLALVPHVWLQAVWTAANALLVVAVLHRLGLAGWRLSLAATGCALLVEPVRETIGFGQINLVLMALVVVDLVPGARDGRRRRLPRGVLTGLAAAIKLTPMLFAVAAVPARQRRTAVTIVSTAAILGLGAALVLPEETWRFAASLAGGDTRTEAAAFRFNQSLLGAVLRLFADQPVVAYLGLALGAITALGGAWVAASWDRRGHRSLAVALCGTATALASPLSWTHHFVWIVPLGVVIWTDTDLPRRLRLVALAYVGWMGLALYKLVPWVYDAPVPYAILQDLISALGPILGLAVLLVAWIENRRPNARTGCSSRETSAVR